MFYGDIINSVIVSVKMICAKYYREYEEKNKTLKLQPKCYPFGNPINGPFRLLRGSEHLNTHLCILIHSRCQLKRKCITWELRVKFYLDQYENCSLGDSTSNNSQRLFQRDRGEGQYICDFGKLGVRVIRHVYFLESSSGLIKLLLVTRNSHHHEGF